MLISYSNCVFLWYFDRHFCFVPSVQELDIMSHLEKKLQYLEEEKHRLECRLKNTELELKETQTSLEQSIVKRRVSKRLAVFFRYEWNFEFIISLQNLGNERVTIFLTALASVLIHLFYSSVSSPTLLSHGTGRIFDQLKISGSDPSYNIFSFSSRNFERLGA